MEVQVLSPAHVTFLATSYASIRRDGCSEFASRSLPTKYCSALAGYQIKDFGPARLPLAFCGGPGFCMSECIVTGLMINPQALGGGKKVQYSDGHANFSFSEMSFAHLHVHSHYACLTASGRRNRLFKGPRKLGMRRCDHRHGVLYGAIEFFKAAKAEGIKPIIGCEVMSPPVRVLIKRRGRKTSPTIWCCWRRPMKDI